MTSQQETITNPEDKMAQAQDDLMNAWGKAMGGGIGVLTVMVVNSLADVGSKVNQSPSYGVMAFEAGLGLLSAYLLHSMERGHECKRGY